MLVNGYNQQAIIHDTLRLSGVDDIVIVKDQQKGNKSNLV